MRLKMEFKAKLAILFHVIIVSDVVMSQITTVAENKAVNQNYDEINLDTIKMHFLGNSMTNGLENFTNETRVNKDEALESTEAPQGVKSSHEKLSDNSEDSTNVVTAETTSDVSTSMTESNMSSEPTEESSTIQSTTTDETTSEDTTMSEDTITNEESTTEETTLSTSEDTTTTEEWTTEETTTEEPSTICSFSETESFNNFTSAISSNREKSSSSSDCVIQNSSYVVSEENLLTISWIVTIQKLCNYTYFIVNMSMQNCREEDICSWTARIPVLDLKYTFKTPLQLCASYSYDMFFDAMDPMEAKISNVIEIYPKLTVHLELVSGRIPITVRWEFPYDSPYCSVVTGFTVEARGESRTVSWGTTYPNDTFFTEIGGLEPCEQYEIMVSPRKTNETLRQYATTKDITISSVEPSSIRNLTIDYIEQLVELKWLPPENGSKCIDNYRVVKESSRLGEEEKQVKTPPNTQTNENFQNVYACVEYSFLVSSVAKSLLVGADIEKTYTIPSRVFGRPSSPRIASNFTATTATLSTSISEVEQKNFCNISRVEFRCVEVQDETIEVLKRGTLLSFEITEFKPFTEYKCYARVENEAGRIGEETGFSPESEDQSFTTREGKPEKPTVSLSKDEITESLCPFAWEAPKNPNGVLRHYNVRINFGNFSYYKSTQCEENFESVEDTVSVGSGNNYIFNKALPSALYYIQVSATNGEETSDYSTPEYCYTLPAPPGEPRELKVMEKQQELRQAYNKTTVITWSLPCRSNGVLKKFLVECENLERAHVNLIYEVSVDDNRETFSLSTEDFLPDSTYNISIKAVTEGHEGKALVQSFVIEAGLPEVTHIETARILVEPSTKLAKLTIPKAIFESEVGRITKILLLLQELGCGTPEPEPNVGFLSDQGRMKTWQEAVNESCVPQYQTASIVEETAKAWETADFFSFTIGTELCETPSLCNGPLTPGTQYALTMRFFTAKGFTDLAYIKITTEKEVPLLVITTLILSVMCIVFAVGFYISYRQTKALRKQTNDSLNDNKDISINDFANFYHKMIANDKEKIREEYTAIQAFSDGLDKTCIASIANEKLNRYSNISPFDYNRVVLNDDELENDYINASYINGYHYPREYIAAQGPKPNTAMDFWRMVLQHKTESIVMLTSLIENNKVKCHEYFPKLNGQITFDNMNISCTSEEDVRSNFIKRVIEVEKNGVKHVLKHYFLSCWPDHGVPCSASGLIEFCKMVRSERQKPDESIIVHCSAGVGRTGTFIALDIIMQRMKQEKKINIFDLVKQLRFQRMKMVQSVDQYIFLYSSALDLVEARKQKPQAFQNISLYLTELKLFNRLKKGSSNLRDKESSF